MTSVIADVTPDNLSRSTLEKLAAISPSKLPSVAGARLGVPLADVGKFVAIGLNCADHAAEANLPLPSEPIVFQKAITSLSGPNDPVILPRGSQKSDWEVEFGIVVSPRASSVERADALAHVAGYCVVNDVSEREYQRERGGRWGKGKECDSFGPAGPWLVTTDEISNPQALDLWLYVKETATTGIRVNCITPAAIRTALFDQMTPQHIEFMLSKIPVGRFGTHRRGDRARLLAGERGVFFTTGAVFDLSGGQATTARTIRMFAPRTDRSKTL